MRSMHGMDVPRARRGCGPLLPAACAVAFQYLHPPDMVIWQANLLKMTDNQLDTTTKRTIAENEQARFAPTASHS